MKILADSVIPWVDKLFSNHGEIARYTGREIDRSQLQGVDVLLTRSTLKINKDLLKGTSVKFVGSATVGCDHVDEVGLEEMGITFAYAPGCNANAVSEYVVAAIAWHEAKGLICFDENQTAAIIGCGHIGCKVKQKLEILGFNVVVNDPPLQLSKLKDWKFVGLEKALKADLICIHTPLTKTGEFPTFHLIDKRELKLINSNAILINAGRGEVINNSALSKFLDKNSNLNVVLDVWENEPNINLQLLNKVNLGTPHIAGHSWRGKVMGTVLLYEQACEFFAWESQSIDQNNLKTQLSVFELNQMHILHDVVSNCYDIEADYNNLLSRVLDENDCETAVHFDHFRKNYYQRPEFRDLQILNNSAEISQLLKNLEFNKLSD